MEIDAQVENLPHTAMRRDGALVASSTISIRIPDDLKLCLEKTARRMGSAKNWIITQALTEFLQCHDSDWLRTEARRQSIAASKKRWKDAKLSEEAAADVWNDR